MEDKKPYKVPKKDFSNTPKQRSYTMSRIKGKNTKPELLLRKALWQEGLRYRLQKKGLPGRPDIVIGKYKLAIFVDGDFWHGFKWEERKPKLKTNRDYWIPKIEGNMARDEDNTQQLEYLGWTVLRFWEHEVKKTLPECLEKVRSTLDKIKEGDL